jgi:predicted acetyltransferase
MPLEIRPCADAEEFAHAIGAIGQYVAWHPTPEEAARFGRNLPLERMHAAFDDGAIVAGAGSFPFELSVPGGSLGCAGVTVVGVAPTHRRRGIMTALMRAQLDAARELAEPLAALWSSEATIYGRFGFGLASWQGEFELDKDRAQFAFPLEPRGSTRFVDADEAIGLLPPIWDAVARRRPGMFSRTRTWWESRIFEDPEDSRPTGAGPRRLVVLQLDGAAQAYAAYRHKPKWEGGASVGKIAVSEAFGTTAQATAEIWRFLLDVDWQAKVHAELLPPDHPLFLLLATPRRAGYRMLDALWVRLVDVGAALSARSYAIDHEIVFDVADAFCPWNEGRWKLEAGRASRTDEEPDLRLDIDALGSGYLGGITFAQLAAALRVEELHRGALERVDAMFRSSAHPWCPEIF